MEFFGSKKNRQVEDKPVKKSVLIRIRVKGCYKSLPKSGHLRFEWRYSNILQVELSALVTLIPQIHPVDVSKKSVCEKQLKNRKL